MNLHITMPSHDSDPSQQRYPTPTLLEHLDRAPFHANNAARARRRRVNILMKTRI